MRNGCEKTKNISRPHLFHTVRLNDAQKAGAFIMNAAAYTAPGHDLRTAVVSVLSLIVLSRKEPAFAMA
eukprot:599589-Amphidinium_carterae.1